MIFLILYLITEDHKNLESALPILSVYALVAIKLLPALQQIYFSVAVIKGNLSAFETIQEDLENANAYKPTNTEESNLTWSKTNKIELQNIFITLRLYFFIEHCKSLFNVKVFYTIHYDTYLTIKSLFSN